MQNLQEVVTIITADTTADAIICLTGATGYVGGRLGPALLEAGYRVRCIGRSRDKLAARAWTQHVRVELVEADMNDEAAMTAALRNSAAAYYLVHSMETAGADYTRRDRELASHFARAAAAAQLPRIIYLGGLGEMGEDLSEHLASRRQVEAVLAGTGVPVTVLRAAMVIGSGSASFEILRYLTERLPVMITPRWVHTECQPIAIRNAIAYLVACLTQPATVGRTLDIGGPEVMRYDQIIQTMAAALGLHRRWIVPVPVLTPRLSSLWIHLVTPLSFRMARPLAEGLRNRVVCRNDEAAHLMPQALLTVRQAIDAALGKQRDNTMETRWSDAGPIPGDPDWAGGKVFIDQREAWVEAGPEAVFDAVCKVGGGHGYYAADWLWRWRGWIDVLAGGPGLRRGRRDVTRLAYGEALDFWRVVGIDRPRQLVLHAEMKLPGVATLQFDIETTADGRARITQTARFKPRGLMGLAYWYAVLPLHHIVFRGMLRGICRQASGERPVV